MQIGGQGTYGVLRPAILIHFTLYKAMKKRAILLLTSVSLAAAAVSVTGDSAFVGLRVRTLQKLWSDLEISFSCR
ncbi:hypothetical protein J2Y73_004730 [Peribacillus frigoritolerans]|nr:hypothetical protein [Peribacillus frigoritolerans]